MTLEEQILELLRQRERTRKELCDITGVSCTAVSKCINRISDKHLIYEDVADVADEEGKVMKYIVYGLSCL